MSEPQKENRLDRIESLLASAQNRMGLSGAALKITAAACMLIDHIGLVLLDDFLPFRLIGRIAFPIFAFLLVEGLVHTSDLRKYLTRICVFALISEVPFDLAVYGTWFEDAHQNVFFTLALGLIAAAALRQNAGSEKKAFLILIIAMAAAEFIASDYGAVGVAVIFVMYYFRDRRVLSSGLSFVLLLLFGARQVCTLPAFLLIALYNGKRGRQPKWFFYCFYPVHLLLLWLIGTYLLS